MPAYAYIVRCSDDSYYTGWTTCLQKRVKLHNEGKASKYTRTRLPVEVVYWAAFQTREEGMKRKREIKALNRAEKKALSRQPPSFQ